MEYLHVPRLSEHLFFLSSRDIMQPEQGIGGGVFEHKHRIICDPGPQGFPAMAPILVQQFIFVSMPEEIIIVTRDPFDYGHPSFLS